MTYDDTLNEIRDTLGFVPGFMRMLPEDALMHDWPIWKKYSLMDSNIPPKYREMMGLAVAANIRCPYCESMHHDMAVMHGATKEELREVAVIASLTARWSVYLHAQHYPMEQFDRERQQMGEFVTKRLLEGWFARCGDEPAKCTT